ncbi:MAG: hypothetical protein M0P57_02330 [Syntrophales bacterium]|jgi:hypothetical protein|nr:hypothetical protein [Syntrophales bacterium]MDY0043338.1 hypothetical protein [Syntrophales bacterium]
MSSISGSYPLPAAAEFLSSLRGSGSVSKGLPPLSVGEIVPACVVESRRNQAVLLIKGSLVTARTDCLLGKGEHRMLTVAALSPKVILRVRSGNISLPAHVKDAFRYCRVEPRSVVRIFSGALSFLREINLSGFAELFGKQDAEKFAAFVSTLLYTGQSAGKDLFFKSYIEKMGFLLEHYIAKTAAKRMTGKAGSFAGIENLKTLLMRMEETLRNIQPEKSSLPVERLLQFLDTSVKAIEMRQVVMSILEENERTYLLQVPVQCANEIHLAEIFIDFGEGCGGKKPGGMTRCKIFIELDSLGPIEADTAIRGKNLECHLFCEKEEITKYISPLLEELERSLNDIGYHIDNVSCKTRDPRTSQEQYIGVFSALFQAEPVDVIA